MTRASLDKDNSCKYLLCVHILGVGVPRI